MEPVWIDLQINGYAGVDFNSPGLTVDAVKEVVRRLAADGTAGFCPTFVTGDPEVVLPNIRTVVAARKADAECARCILGLHLEGPFISPELGAVGSHPIEWVTTPSLEKFARYQDAAEGLVRLSRDRASWCRSATRWRRHRRRSSRALLRACVRSRTSATASRT